MEKLLREFRTSPLALLIDEGESPRAALIAPAQEINIETVNRILTLTGGHIFVALSPERAQSFMLDPMPSGGIAENLTLPLYTSVEAREGVTTGISASDRTKTIRILGEREPRAQALVRPGHIFPVATKDGGVLVRPSLFEGGLDLVVSAGFSDAAVVVDLLKTNGEFPTLDEIYAFAQKEKIPFGNLADLVRHRLVTEPLIEKIAESKLPTKEAGDLRAVVFKSKLHIQEHVALVKGDIALEDAVLTRVQSEFTFADIMDSAEIPTRSLLSKSLSKIGQHGSGVLVYLRRGDLAEQIEGWTEEYNRRPASRMREFGVGVQILKNLGVKRIRLLSNSPTLPSGLEKFGLEVKESVPL